MKISRWKLLVIPSITWSIYPLLCSITYDQKLSKWMHGVTSIILLLWPSLRVQSRSGTPCLLCFPFDIDINARIHVRDLNLQIGIRNLGLGFWNLIGGALTLGLMFSRESYLIAFKDADFEVAVEVCGRWHNLYWRMICFCYWVDLFPSILLLIVLFY